MKTLGLIPRVGFIVLGCLLTANLHAQPLAVDERESLTLPGIWANAEVEDMYYIYPNGFSVHSMWIGNTSADLYVWFNFGYSNSIRKKGFDPVVTNNYGELGELLSPPTDESEDAVYGFVSSIYTLPISFVGLPKREWYIFEAYTRVNAWDVDRPATNDTWRAGHAIDVWHQNPN